jgi:prepilin-type N-terminal cleavage/methylation domain-containing protein
MHQAVSKRVLGARTVAFTLIELLVVVAILALLMSILLPALNGAREQGKAVVCQSNLRMLSVAVYMYAEDNKSYFPQWGLGHGSGEAKAKYSWLKTMGPEYGEVTKLLRCPADHSPYWTQPGDQGKYRSTSYAANLYLATVGASNPLWDRDAHDYNRLDWIKQPCSTIFFCELAEQGDIAVADHIHVDGWDGAYPDERSQAATELALGRHRGKEGYGFVDGHAEVLPFEKTFQIKSRLVGDDGVEVEWFHNKYDPTIAR